MIPYNNTSIYTDLGVVKSEIDQGKQNPSRYHTIENKSNSKKRKKRTSQSVDHGFSESIKRSERSKPIPRVDRASKSRRIDHEISLNVSIDRDKIFARRLSGKQKKNFKSASLKSNISSKQIKEKKNQMINSYTGNFAPNFHENDSLKFKNASKLKQFYRDNPTEINRFYPNF